MRAATLRLAVAALAGVVDLTAVAALAAFPGANGLIAFESDRDGGDAIWVVNPDGSGLRKLTDHPDEDHEPQWSPDGARITFRRSDDEEREIWVMNGDGGGQARLTENEDEDQKSSWSADGSRIVFESDRDGPKQIYVMRRDGANPTNLSNDLDVEDHEPVWSPDGTRIAFRRGDDGDEREIWVMNADGSGKTRLTFNDAEDEDPAWSPDGSMIVFESDRDGPKQIYVMNADGTDQRRVATTGSDDVDPEWSPDGTKIVFISDRDGDEFLYVMNVDGSAAARVTDEPGDENPSWQPIPATTTTLPPTTTTTLPGGGMPLPGKKLLLKDNAAKPQKRALKLLVKDAVIGAGSQNGSSGDPTLHGGFLKVVSRSGDRFATTYELPESSWSYKGKEGRNKGYKLRDAGPIRKMLVKLKRGTVKIVAKGEMLGHSLGSDPNPVHVALGLGDQVYCFSFGGKTKHKPGKKYVATKAFEPDSCAALEPVCGDGLLEPGESCPALEGPEDGLAIEAVSEFEDLADVPESAIGPDEAGDLVVRTQYDLVFTENATVGQVNAAIAAVNGRIVSMLALVPSVLIEVPDPGSPVGIATLIATLEGRPGVTQVLESHVIAPERLPSNYTNVQNPDLSYIDHHLAVRAHAAWNARGALQGSFLGVVVEDWFGDGVPDAAFDVNAVAQSDFSSGTTDEDGEHGYHVLGIMAGEFGGDATDRGLVTGIVTDGIQLRVVDRLDRRYRGTSAAMRKAIRLLANGPGMRVFSTSLGYSEACGIDAGRLNARAAWWIDAARRRSLEGKVLHLTSAGNINSVDCPTLTDAITNSHYTAAALAPVVDTGGAPLLNLSNVLVIENAANTIAQPFEPACLSVSSKFPGHLAGIGTAVWSFQSADITGIGTAPPADNKSGTSMATPQVAGLAAYLWKLAPTMTVDELRRTLLTNTIDNVGGPAVGTCAGPSAPVIDAYAAALALDEAAAPTPGGAPVRLALLDVDDDGDFDELDVFDFTAILLDSTTGLVQEPTKPEYQRYDLNGDGWSGGADRRAAFDLDRTGSTRYGASQLDEVTQTVEGVAIPFAESAASDLDVLCYYAYSGLFTGNTDRRRDLLGLARCARIDMSLDFASTIMPNTDVPLTVSVGREGETGSEPVENVYIEISPLGGTATPMSGTTDAQGELVSQIRLDPGSTFVEIVVQALAGPGGEVLAEEFVSAGAPCTDPPAMLELDFGNGEPDPTVVGPILQNGAEYRITASGTYSIWTGEWGNGACKGTPDAGSDGPTGLDAEYWFAIPVGSALCRDDFDCCPNGTDKFRISLDDGAAFDHIAPVVGDYTTSHVYEYRVRGRGQPVHFQIEESSARGDDYGILALQIACASDTTTTTTSSSSTTSTTTTTSTSSTTVSITTTTATSTTSTSTTLFAVPVVPYARYAATGPDGPVAMLADEFTTESVDLGTVGLELPPVTIDGLLPPDPDTHQTCWTHPGGLLDTCIDVQDRFGPAPLRVGNPVAVCVPELSPAVAVDAFKCYQATGTPIDQPVALEDDFQTQAVTVGAPELLCTPVEVDGDPLTNAGRYLVCYATTPAGAAGGAISVENALSGGPIQVDVGTATGLCVPALRQLVATCQLCGNGVPEGDEECDDGNVVAGDGCSPVCALEP